MAAPPNPARDVWITGVGLSSALGDGPAGHWGRLADSRAGPAPAERRAGRPVHPLGPVDLGRHVPNRLDLKRLGAVQSLGVHAAGEALAEAGLLGDRERLARTVVLVGGGGGERDVAFDESVLAEAALYADGAALNQRLATGTRPSLFLAQLPNLLAGNVSIFLGVSGGSRTFLGEELAGANALRAGLRLLADGVYDTALVGGSFVATREDIVLFYGLGGFLWRDEPAPVWARREGGGGMVLGSAAAFLALERAGAARARGARPLGRLASVEVRQSRRAPGDVGRAVDAMIAAAAPPESFGVISGATGAEPATGEELAALGAWRRSAGAPVRAPGSVTGHGMEASLPFNVALGALALRHGTLPPAAWGDLEDAQPPGGLDHVLVTGVGHWRGESVARLDRVEEGGRDG